MDLIDCIRVGLLLFNGVGLIILALYPTQQDLADYEYWISTLDKAYRTRRDQGSKLKLTCC